MRCEHSGRPLAEACLSSIDSGLLRSDVLGPDPLRKCVLKGDRHKRSYRSPSHFGCPTVIYVQLSRRSQSSWVGVRGSASQPHPAIAALLGRFLPRLGSLSTTPAAFLFVYTATSAAIPRQLRDVGRESVMRTKADPADARACVSRPSSKC
jgi:hypothetical protein